MRKLCCRFLSINVVKQVNVEEIDPENHEIIMAVHESGFLYHRAGTQQKKAGSNFGALIFSGSSFSNPFMPLFPIRHIDTVFSNLLIVVITVFSNLLIVVITSIGLQALGMAICRTPSAFSTLPDNNSS